MSFRYSIIPAGAIIDWRLEPRDLQVLALLGRYNERGGWLWRNQSKMAVELDVSRRTIQRALDRLVEAGWVEKRPRGYGKKLPDPNKQPFASLEYRVKLDNEVPPEEALPDEIDDPGDEDRCVTDDAPRVTDDAPGASRMAHSKEPLGILESESAHAREPLVSREAIETAEAVAAIAGYPEPAGWPPGWCGAPMRVQSFLSEGYHPQHLMIGARAVMAGKPAEFRPWSIEYFARSFADARGRAEAPVPKPTVGGPRERSSQTRRGGNVHAAIDRLIERFDEQTGAPESGGADGESSPRRLFHGGSS